MLQELDQTGADAGSSCAASGASISKPVKLGLSKHTDRHGELLEMTLVSGLRPLCSMDCP